MKMSPVTKNTQSGFTLVELAIVMIIIGLLIGGVLKGQELIDNARLTSVMQQVHPNEVALASFKTLYDFTPGDFNQVNRLPDCTGDCLTTVVNSNGDGWLNVIAANVIRSNIYVGACCGYEGAQYWYQLAGAGLTEEVTSAGTAGGTISVGWGVTSPEAKLQGTGFNVAEMNIPPTGNWQALRGIYLILSRAYNYGWLQWGYGAGSDALSAAQAHQIDTKMDDGRPLTGRVRAISAAGADTDGCPGATGDTYTDNVTAVRACNMLFKISN